MTTRNTWSVVVADDEPAARRGVRQLLAAFPDFVVVRECRDGREALAALDALHPDVLFLDIQMPEIDGFEVIRRRTPERMPAVVFLTAFDGYAIRAFDAAAHDYLVKPVTEARFAVTMQRLAARLTPGGRSAFDDRAIVVATPRGTTVVPVREIDWIEAAGNYARLWVGSRSYLLRESLGELERRVGPQGFVRAHRQALVRMDGVRELRAAAVGLTAILGTGAQITVSRRQKSTFAAALRARRA